MTTGEVTEEEAGWEIPPLLKGEGIAVVMVVLKEAIVVNQIGTDRCEAIMEGVLEEQT